MRDALAQRGAAYRRDVGAALTALALAAGVPAAPAEARVTFDGVWSLVIQTERGDCAPSYRQAVRIVRGTVYEAGDSDAQALINGRVDAAGRVQVSVRRGDQSAVGSGRLSETSGSGTWTSSSAACSGRWTAQRRG